MSQKPTEWKRTVADSLHVWSQEADRWREALDKFRRNLSDECRSTVGKLDPFILTSMIKASGHIDRDYVEGLLTGFPITGSVDSCGTGTPIPGGQRSHRRPAYGVVPQLNELRSKCKEINQKTVKRAQSRIPKTVEEHKLASATWEKVLTETAKGRTGLPVDLESFDLEEGLLVDTFGIWERHGDASEDTLRLINDFRANQANEFAYMPERLSYDGFGEIKEACAEFHRRCGRKLGWGRRTLSQHSKPCLSMLINSGSAIRWSIIQSCRSYR